MSTVAGDQVTTHAQRSNNASGEQKQRRTMTPAQLRIAVVWEEDHGRGRKGRAGQTKGTAMGLFGDGQ